jgi:ribosomal protein S18 acetylase RimI-like enzyme
MARLGSAARADRTSSMTQKDSPASVVPNVLSGRTEVQLREFQNKDRAKIQEILEEARNFTSEEIEVAMSLVDEMIRGDSTYRFLVAVNRNDIPVGYICYGPTPMTAGTWDIYWIAVSKRFQRRHVGSLLLREVEKEIVSHRGRLILIDTSSKSSYRATRAFYYKMGYRVSARIRGFYSDRDDRLIFCKYTVTSRDA